MLTQKQQQQQRQSCDWERHKINHTTKLHKSGKCKSQQRC